VQLNNYISSPRIAASDRYIPFPRLFLGTCHRSRPWSW